MSVTAYKDKVFIAKKFIEVYFDPLFCLYEWREFSLIYMFQWDWDDVKEFYFSVTIVWKNTLSVRIATQLADIIADNRHSTHYSVWILHTYKVTKKKKISET